MNALIRICSSVFLIIGFNALGFADEHFPFVATANKDSINVRAGANINFVTIEQLHLGQEVVVKAKVFDWYKIQLSSGAKAFIRADYLDVHKDQTAQVDGDRVNIRAAANSDATAIGQIMNGSLVKVISQQNGWCQIVPPTEAGGWVHQDLLTFKSQTVDPSILRSAVILPSQDKSQEKSQ